MTATANTWRAPTQPQKVTCDEVHVWRAFLDQEASIVHDMKQILSTGERDRARQFYFEIDRSHYIMARGFLRVILSRYLDIDPSQLRFRYNPYGKPSLASPWDQERLHFNVSHSDGLALYVVAHGRRVGIDLERIREDVSFELLAKHFFSPLENATLNSFPAEAKNKAFFDCWSRKEAYIKARGEGLTIPLKQFDVSLEPDEPARLLNNRIYPDDVSHWSLQEINPSRGYAAAMAVEGHDWRVTCFDMAEVNNVGLC